VRTRRPRPLALAAGLLLAGVAVLAVVGLAALAESGSHPLGPAISSALEDAQPAAAPFTGRRGIRLAVGGRCLRLVASVTVAERQAGLRHVRDLGPYDGMLFVDETSSRSAFTMQDTLVPLDLGLYDAAGRPVETHALVPCPASANRCPITTPRRGYRLAIEAPGGSLPSGALGGC
jgi:uncharacterized membrane protein (UPF0127 family)